eukprot:5213851-Pleurochrysis_carterae.AAC.1
MPCHSANAFAESSPARSTLDACGPQNEDGTNVRRIGKSSDPDHPFHPCDDIDSDDAAIQALLDSSSGHTQESELEYDPTDPCCDPFATAESNATAHATATNASAAGS